MAKATKQLQVSSPYSHNMAPAPIQVALTTTHYTAQSYSDQRGLSLDKILKCLSMHRHAQLQSLGKSEASTQENSGECAICLGAVLVGSRSLNNPLNSF
jgi:hypothetical protein